MHLRRKAVPSGKSKHFYYSICQTSWDTKTKRPKEKTLVYLGKAPIITEEQAEKKGIPIKELEALTKRSDLRISVRTDILPSRLKRIINTTKKRIPASVWDDFKRFGFHLQFKMSNKTTGLAGALNKPSFRPFVASSGNKLTILLSPALALHDDEPLIQCGIAEEIAHQYAWAKRCAEVLRNENTPQKSVFEEEGWVLLMLRQWGFSEEEVTRFASSKNWLAYATQEWG